MTFAARACKSMLPVCLIALTGCALTNTAIPSVAPPDTGAAIQGVVHGGQQPVAGAHVYLFAAGTTGYGGNGIAASSSNASASVFTAAETGLSDSVGPYILTNAGGNFSFPTYTCTPGTQVYVYVHGGNPGNGTNSALGLMAALGNCPTAGNLNSITYISINEITTIAAAYALAGFATDATHIGSSGTALAKTGIANAFLNATNLANLATGAALATTPAGNGTVPHDEIITLADIIAYCVNSNDVNSAISANCSTLFGYTLSGGTTGTAPTDTASAAINIAHNPGANVGNLFGLAAAKSPYVTTNSYSQPNDWTIGITFSGGGFNAPWGAAIDAAGNAWFANNGNNSLTELSSLGAPISTSAGFKGGGMNFPTQVAIDPSGYIWVGNEGNVLSKFNSSGAAVSTSGYTGGGLSAPLAIAIDGSGNIWAGNAYAQTVSEFNSSGTPVSANGYSGGGLYYPRGIAIDTSGDLWTTDYGTGKLSEIKSNGTASTGSPFSGGGLASGVKAVAIDSSGNLWTADGNTGNGNVSEFSSAGAAISPSAGYLVGSNTDTYTAAIDGAGNAWFSADDAFDNGSGPYGFLVEVSTLGSEISPSSGYTSGILNSGYEQGALAIDGSGDVWVTNVYGAVTVLEVIGAAAPVVTPLVSGVINHTLGTRP